MTMPAAPQAEMTSRTDRLMTAAKDNANGNYWWLFMRVVAVLWVVAAPLLAWILLSIVASIEDRAQVKSALTEISRRLECQETELRELRLENAKIRVDLAKIMAHLDIDRQRSSKVGEASLDSKTEENALARAEKKTNG